MADMWKRLKNWLIKKLGGYTKAEVDALRYLTATYREPRVVAKSGEIVTLRTEAWFDHFNLPPAEWAKDKIAVSLAMKMKPYVRWEAKDDHSGMKQSIRATVRVVKWDGGELL